MISFWLSGRGRVIFLVGGPAPGCDVAGTFAYAGHRGQNRVRFTGKIAGRRLQPGKYTITPIRIRGSTPANRPSVGVAVRRDGSVPAEVTEACGAQAASTQGTVPTSSRSPASTDRATQPEAPSSKPKPARPGKLKLGGVLGVFKAPELRFPGASDGMPWFLSVPALILLVTGAAFVAFLIDFVRQEP